MPESCLEFRGRHAFVDDYALYAAMVFIRAQGARVLGELDDKDVVLLRLLDEWIKEIGEAPPGCVAIPLDQEMFEGIVQSFVALIERAERTASSFQEWIPGEMLNTFVHDPKFAFRQHKASTATATLEKLRNLIVGTQ